METEQSFLVPLHYPNSESNPISYVRNSSLKNTVVAQHVDGKFSILRIQDSGKLSKFALDPQLKR